MPRPDFPKNFPEFVRWFPDDEACWQYLVETRWPDGVTCEDGHQAWLYEARKRFVCADGLQFSVTSGTIMHRSKLPLHVWLWGAYLVTSNTPGMSATQFARQLDVNLEAAFMLLHKLRAAMVEPDRVKLKGLVEMDEAFISGGREREGKKDALQTIIGAVEVKANNRAGRLRLRLANSKGIRDVVKFARDYITEGATVMTDGNTAYKSLEPEWRHEVEEADVEQVLPHIHRVFSNLKTWILGTHHGAIMHKHLQAYLNEFVFRFNRRDNPMAAFQTVLGIGSAVRGPTYAGIESGDWAHPNPKRRSKWL